MSIPKGKSGRSCAVGKEPHSRFCCIAKTRGCKDPDALNYDESVDIDVPSSCIAKCGANSVAQNGRCVCNEGWGGATCERQVTLVAKKNFLASVRVNRIQQLPTFRRGKRVVENIRC